MNDCYEQLMGDSNGSNEISAFAARLPGENEGLRTRGPKAVEPWPEPVDGSVLLEELKDVLLRHVILSASAAETLALWTLHTYAFEYRDVTTYVGIESPEKRCGKTTLLSVLNKMANRPVAAANISSSALFRVIQELRPTLLIDEADTLLQGNDELRGILNAGYGRATGFVMRVASQSGEHRGTQNGANETKGTNGTNGGHPSSRLVSFSCWCPKVMAAIGRLPDTLADRCIVIRMQRKSANERCERLRNLEAGPIRRKCARFVQDNAERIAEARPEVPTELHDRAADIWEPLLVLADLAGGEWPKRARLAAMTLSSNSEEDNPIGSLLLDIFLIMAVAGGERAFSRTVVQGLNQRPDRPWAELRKGKPVTELWLAQQLRPYGLQPRMIWIAGEQARGYFREDFKEVLRRYVPRQEIEALKEEGVGHKS